MSKDGLFLLGLVDSWGRDYPQYGAALWHTAIRKELEKVTVHEPRLFDGSLRQKCQGICKPTPTPTPPGTGQAYPSLPPLAGVGYQEDVLSRRT